jgi:hypothetical protein
MDKNFIVLLIISSIFLFFTCSVCSVVGVGVSPAEIRAQNIIGSGIIGTMTIVNTVNESRNIVIEIQSPSELPNEQQHLRVICENCHDTHQRYEIINKCCPKCGSSDLTVYERIPEDVLKYLSLEGNDCTLIKNGSIYVTEEQYGMKEECNIEIIIDLPSRTEYSNKNWEVHISITTTSNISSVNMGMSAGAQMRHLLDTSNISPDLLSLPVDILPYIIVGIILSIIFVVTMYIKRKTIIAILTNFRNRNIIAQKKLREKKKLSSSYYLNKDEKNISLINNKPFESSENMKPDFESTNKTKKDNKVFKNIEEEVDKLLSNLKQND